MTDTSRKPKTRREFLRSIARAAALGALAAAAVAIGGRRSTANRTQACADADGCDRCNLRHRCEQQKDDRRAG